MTMNAAATLLEHGDAGRIAIACGSEQISYDALRDATARAASAWRQRGIADGERVAIKLPDGYPWVRSFLGTIWAGGVAVAVNPRIAADDWRFILGEQPFHLILAESAADTPPEFRDRVVILDEWLREATSSAPMAPELVEADAPAFWTHSSGTSGKPKAVVHAHRFALAVDSVAEKLLGLGADDRFFASSKLFFAYPLGNSLFAGLKLGGTVILDPQWPTAASVAATAAQQKPSAFFSVPALYRNLLKAGLARQLVEAGVRVFVSAGEALPASLRDEWRKQTGLSIVNGYGASETLNLVLLNSGEGEDLSSTPGVDIQPLDQSNGSPTRIRIKAPTLALGYWHRPDADAQNFHDGAFCPADLFEPSGTNAWRFAGREDSLVKVRGRWVNLVELEERLAAACPCIVEAAAAVFPDDDGVAAIGFFYVLKSDPPAGCTCALQACMESLPHYQRPRWLREVKALPRTATGKLVRRKLRELHALHATEYVETPVIATSYR
jgi:acyl-coenzyme A synthetase/AMP-(fatty) acid ligase